MRKILPDDRLCELNRDIIKQFISDDCTHSVGITVVPDFMKKLDDFMKIGQLGSVEGRPVTNNVSYKGNGRHCSGDIRGGW
jgi:hypothetical protein